MNEPPVTNHSKNPYAPPSPPSAPKRDWLTWSPFQSAMLKEISANMTASEKRRGLYRGLFYGFWVALSFMLPVQGIILGLTTNVAGTAVALISGLVVLVHFSVIPFWLRSQRRFLCDTEWAKENRIQTDQLRWFR